MKKLMLLSVLLAVGCASTARSPQVANDYFDKVEECIVFGCSVMCSNAYSARVATTVWEEGRPDNKDDLLRYYSAMSNNCFVIDSQGRYLVRSD